MKLIILDRDGTLNVPRDDFITTPADWEPLPGALEAVARLNQAGWHVVIVCNQPALGRGLLDMASLNAIHTKMNKALAGGGAGWMRCFFAPMCLMTNALAASPFPVCFTRLPSALVCRWRGCQRPEIRSPMPWPLLRWGANPICC